MHAPTQPHSPTAPPPVNGRVSALTPKGLLSVQLYRLQDLVDLLTDAERLDLVTELTPFVRCARARVESRQGQTGQVA